MPVTGAQAQAIMQAVTADVWNQTSKTERIKLLGTILRTNNKGFARPMEAERLVSKKIVPLARTSDISADVQHSATATTTSSTRTGGKIGCLRGLGICG